MRGRRVALRRPPTLRVRLMRQSILDKTQKLHHGPALPGKRHHLVYIQLHPTLALDIPDELLECKAVHE